MTSKSLRECGIYCIRNLINGKRYIGSSNNLRRRLIGHKHRLKKGNHVNRVLQSAWNKYGEAAFVFEILKLCDVSDCLHQEQEFVDRLNCIAPGGYNLRKDVTANYGLRHTDESKRKISEAQTGRKLPEAWCKNIGNGKRGSKHSDESKAKISTARTGITPKWTDPIGRGLKISEARTGYVMPELTKRKLSKIFSGKSKLSAGIKTNIKFLSNFGKTRCQIAELLGIDRHTVGGILSGKTE